MGADYRNWSGSFVTNISDTDSLKRALDISVSLANLHRYYFLSTTISFFQHLISSLFSLRNSVLTMLLDFQCLILVVTLEEFCHNQIYFIHLPLILVHFLLLITHFKTYKLVLIRYLLILYFSFSSLFRSVFPFFLLSFILLIL